MKLHCLFSLTLKVRSVIGNKLTYCNGFAANSSVVFKRSFTVNNSVNYQQWGKNKKHRNVKLQLYFDSMADPQIEEVLAPLRANVKEQVILG